MRATLKSQEGSVIDLGRARALRVFEGSYGIALGDRALRTHEFMFQRLTLPCPHKIGQDCVSW
ncbi:hypothetical protein CHY08_13210 [Rhizobium leguminosarum bv. viciae]|nr:hypothetical protein CHY08_13210 [Rhizobium leguminosarum bv. viciae]